MQRPEHLRDKAGQLLFVRMGSNMDPPVLAEEEYDRISEVLERCPVGGLLVFNGRFGETGGALRGLQASSRFPLLVAADMERGEGQQLHGATVFPHAMALAVQGVGSAGDAREMGRITAEEALSEGVNYVLGPVADLNRNPKNPIIGARSFGKVPEVVAELVRSYVEGCRSAGALVAPKHFPGHGNTQEDSHSAVPRIPGSLEELAGTDLVPFRAAIDAGCDTVMTAHAAYPDVDPSGCVATNSPLILQQVLRSDFGFEGAIATDSLLMEGVRRFYSDPAAMVVDLIRVGQDILLDVEDAGAAADAIVEAVANGSLSRETVERAFERVWALKERLAERLGPEFHVHPPEPPSQDEMRAHRQAAQRVAQQALVPRGVPGPLRGREGCIFVMVKPYRTHLDPELEPLGHLALDTFGEGAYYQIGDHTDEQSLEDVCRRCAQATELVVAVVVRPAAWRRFGLSERLTEHVRMLLKSAGRPTLLVLGAPEGLGELVDEWPSLATFSDVEPSQRAAFDWLVRKG